MKKLTLLAWAVLLALPLPAADKAAGAEWSQESSANGVTVYSRLPSGSSLKEFKGVGLVAAPASIVFAVLADNEAYPAFMPYTAESRVLKREKDSVLAYQRLTFPLLSDRDYTVRSQYANWLGPDGPIYRMRWEAANDLGPAARPGILRVNVCDGAWLLEQQETASTRATYTIFTDSGGSLPAFVANSASRIGIGKIFAAVRKQVKDPKYAAPLNSSAPNNSR